MNKKVENPTKEEIKKEPIKKVEEKKEEIIPETIIEEKGINLIPIMSKDEINQEEKKKKINMSALISLSTLFLVSMVVIGFNIISKVQLNNEKEKLFEYEKKMEVYHHMIINNNQILQRVSLYKDIQDGRYSSKAVVDYVQSIATKSGSSELNEFNFTGERSFSFSGSAQDLEDVAKLWYLLTNDSRIEGVVLKSLSRSDIGTNFSFNGDLKLDQFVNSINN